MAISCDLRLENNECVYKPGDMLIGSLTVGFQECTAIKALALKVSGYAIAKWVKPTKKAKKEKKHKKKKEKTIEYEQRQDFLSTTQYFVGSDDAKATRQIEPGSYLYSISVHLPTHCPTNFESTIGQVRYEMEVFVDYADRQESCYKRNFFVKQPLDLRSIAGLDQSCSIDVFQKKSSFRFWQRPIQLQVSVPRLGYIPTEHIPVAVKILNYDLVNLTDIIFKLNLVATFSGMHKKKAASTLERRNLTTLTHNLFGQNATVIQNMQTLCVPDDLTPTLYVFDCRCIQISYELEVQLISPNKRRCLNAIMPLTIGTISIHDPPNDSFAPRDFSGKTVALSTARSENNLSALPSAPPEYTLNGSEEAITSVTVSALINSSSFREADYMQSANLSDKKKHSKSMDELNFKPKYLYYNMNNPIVEEESSSDMGSLRAIPPEMHMNDINAIHVDRDYREKS